MCYASVIIYDGLAWSRGDSHVRPQISMRRAFRHGLPNTSRAASFSHKLRLPAACRLPLAACPCYLRWARATQDGHTPAETAKLLGHKKTLRALEHGSQADHGFSLAY